MHAIDGLFGVKSSGFDVNANSGCIWGFHGSIVAFFDSKHLLDGLLWGVEDRDGAGGFFCFIAAGLVAVGHVGVASQEGFCFIQRDACDKAVGNAVLVCVKAEEHVFFIQSVVLAAGREDLGRLKCCRKKDAGDGNGTDEE